MIYRSFFKRFFDIILSFIAFLLLSPIFILVVVLLSFANKGSGVFFLQERPGKDGRIFKVIKFKSMTDERDSEGNLLPNERRITPIGSFIRKSSLDELPQLINVFKGDMSLIGPRPLRVDYLPLYNLEQKKRHHIKPGITGWAQVNGRNAISWTKKFELDVWYVEHVTFILDLKILLLTFLKVVKSQDINNSPEHIGTEKFNGSN